MNTAFPTTWRQLSWHLKARPHPSIQATVSDHIHKITSLESNANLQDERLLALCATLMESNARLLAKATDLESRRRRNNIRIVGLPESIEGPHPSTFFSELLVEVLGDGVLSLPLECDKAHWSLSDKPKPGLRPRPGHHPATQIRTEGEDHPQSLGQEG